MKKIIKKAIMIFMVAAIVCMMGTPFTVFAANENDTTADVVTETDADTETNAEKSVDAKAIAAAIAVGLAALGGALGMGMGIAKSVEGISRQPEAEGKIRTTLMLGLVFVETAIIYALVIAILIIFVL